jgi:hypothetical protein
MKSSCSTLSWARDGALMAQAFDPQRELLTGEAGHRHAHRQVLALDVGRADVLRLALPLRHPQIAGPLGHWKDDAITRH